MKTDTPKYPRITVQFVGEDSNAFSILGRCAAAMRAAGLGPDEVRAFREEATAGDYDHLLRTAVKWFDVS